MHIKPQNLRFPSQTPYAFADGELHADPIALRQIYSHKHTHSLRTANNPYIRSFEKAQRLERMARRAAKNQIRCHD